MRGEIFNLKKVIHVDSGSKSVQKTALGVKKTLSYHLRDHTDFHQYAFYGVVTGVKENILFLFWSSNLQYS
jgi:hypothetical protein